MRSSGLTPNDVYLTFLLKCRPTRAYNRDESRAACLPYLSRQLAERNPRFLFPLNLLSSSYDIKESPDVGNKIRKILLFTG
ncbi:MAG: hypothetical protein PHO01_09515 [Desulfotomaculaceae bacterium]|nr:hypothetical protein [Desulfotomaculaceae bacterium]